jgi:capsular exopolysaccharide synthesis family protein
MMLNKLAWQSAAPSPTATAAEPTIDLVEIFRLLWRQRLLVAGVLGAAIAIAILYLMIAPARYTASSMVLFDVRQSDPLQPPAPTNPATDSAYVDSQVEILQSESLARSVVTKLNLDSDPEFSPAPSLLSRAIAIVLDPIVAKLNAIFKDEDAVAPDRLTPLVAFFKSNLTIKRIGLTYIVKVDYRSLDPAKAARISNAVVDAYVVSQLDSKFNAARQANGWVRTRIDELKSQAQNAERAVAEYKAKNNIAVDGRVPSEPELVALSAERRAALKDLESTAQINRALYDTFVQRATQQQSFPTTEARVVSPATPPLEKSYPKTLLVLAAAMLLGLVGGVGAAFAREQLSTVFLSPSQLERDIGINCLGVVPAVPSDTDAGSQPERSNDLGAVPSGQAAGGRCIIRDPSRYTCVVDAPFSLWTEAIRFLAADITTVGTPTRVIGVCSALPGEGKSMTASNLAELVAAAGRKVLLIDCDLRKSGLTQRLAPEAAEGLLDVIAGRAAVKDLVWRDPVTKLDFLPASQQAIHAAHPSATLSSAPMLKLLVEAQDEYDHLILDLPPIIPVADVKAASHLIEAFILVIEWGRTSQSAVKEALSTAPLVSERLMGAFLNKADPKVLKQLESYRGTVTTEPRSNAWRNWRASARQFFRPSPHFPPWSS